jgi:hypothetical protein
MNATATFNSSGTDVYLNHQSVTHQLPEVLVAEVNEMDPSTGCAARSQCAAGTGCQLTAAPFSRGEFMNNLRALLGQEVEIVPMHLPGPCSSLWLGFTGVDRIGFNPDWPGQEVTLTAHAIGHLALGHCGSTRDGGQFACVAAHTQLTCCDEDLLRRLLHDPAERLSRLFSDREEQAAGAFAAGLEQRLGRACAQQPGGTCRPGGDSACIG